MEMMPPVGWADVATKRDLDALEQRMDLRFEAMDHRFEAIDHRFEAMEQCFESMDRRFDATGHQIEAMEHKLLATFRGELLTTVSTQTKTLMLAHLGAVLSTATLAFAAARLA